MFPFVPVLMLALFAGIVAAIILVLHRVLGMLGTRPTPGRGVEAKTEPYESGVLPVGTARTRFHVRFFMIAILFLLFDVEVIFFYLWGPMAHRLQWFGVLEMLVFTSVLVLGLAYAWGKGALEQE